MSTDQSVQRDERTVTVENASYRWAINFIIFALLFDVACRGVFFDEAAWDLLALAIVPGLVCTIYQYRQKILGRPPGRMILSLFVGAIFAAIMAFIIAFFKLM